MHASHISKKKPGQLFDTQTNVCHTPDKTMSIGNKFGSQTNQKKKTISAESHKIRKVVPILPLNSSESQIIIIY